MRTMLSIAAMAIALSGCQSDPVQWNDAAERRAVVPAASAAHPLVDVMADSIMHDALAAAMHSADSPGSTLADSLPSAVLATDGVACPATVRVSSSRGALRAAAWWSTRPNRSAALMSTVSTDGGRSWSAPVRVDTLDVGGAGCARPAPSVAVDARNGYVHVAYAIAAPEGTGVFYAHRMGPTLRFERPQVITYGDRVTAASVASDGDLVAVAYEDPNTGERPYVSLALSRTAGHSWAERLEVSSDGESAERPAVAMRGRDVAVGWLVRNTQRAMGGANATTAAPDGMVVVRVGRVR